jgi:hypothetical protein
MSLSTEETKNPESTPRVALYKKNMIHVSPKRFHLRCLYYYDLQFSVRLMTLVAALFQKEAGFA